MGRVVQLPYRHLGLELRLFQKLMHVIYNNVYVYKKIKSFTIAKQIKVWRKVEKCEN